MGSPRYARIKEQLYGAMYSMSLRRLHQIAVDNREAEMNTTK